MAPVGRIRRRFSPELLAVIVANTLPIVGIVALGWNVVALVVLYWIELAVSFCFALLRATFAGRPSEYGRPSEDDSDPPILGALRRKRASLSLPWTEVGIRLSTLPVLVFAVPFMSAVWFFAGVVTVGIVAPESPDSGMVETVVIAGFGVFLTELARTGFEYFYRGGYREHSAQTALQGELFRGVAIGIGGLAIAFLAAVVSGSVAADEPISSLDPSVVGTPVLIGIVLVKLAFDLADVYSDRLVELDESSSFRLGFAYEPPTEEPIDTSLSADATRLRPGLRARVLGGITQLGRQPGAWLIGVFPFLIGVLLALGQLWVIVVALLVLSVVLPVLVAQVDYWLRHGWVEYRTDGDAVVAYDRLFRTPLWRVEPWDETGLRVERDRVDAWLDTATVVIELPGTERRLPQLPDVDPILETFDRRPDRPE
jgi:hypothetical protein